MNLCVHSIGQVSWIRHRDIHILTVGSYTYTSDQRFQATHDKENGDWTLQIKWVQKRDKGAYECQVSTQPVMSYFVNLEVVGKQKQYEHLARTRSAYIDSPIPSALALCNPKTVPTAYIIGGPDLHVDKGSTINLTCSVRYSLEPPAYIFWFHQDEVSIGVLGTHLFGMHLLFTLHHHQAEAVECRVECLKYITARTEHSGSTAGPKTLVLKCLKRGRGGRNRFKTNTHKLI